MDETMIVPDGWKLVPIEPNWDMRNEGREFLIDGIEKEPEKLAYFLWKTMIAAAPEPKALSTSAGAAPLALHRQSHIPPERNPTQPPEPTPNRD